MKSTLTLIFTLLLLLTSSVHAQETPPIELGEPIITNYGYWGAENVVWLDNETLIVQAYPYSEGEMPIAYRYHAPTGETTALSESPLWFQPSPEEIVYFQMGVNNLTGRIIASQSPFSAENNPQIIYPSTMRLECAGGCAAVLLMAGERGFAAEGVDGSYRPLDIFELLGMRTIWARGGTAAIVLNAGYNCCGTLYHIELRDDYPDTRIGSLDSPDADFYAVSADGNRVLYSQWAAQSSLQLVLWEMETLSVDGFNGTRTETTIIEPQTDEYYAFTGANFVEDDPTQIIAVHHDGLMRIDLETDARTIINPDLNAAWIDLAFLSPDNRYIAVIDDGAVYVVETGL